MKIEIKNIKYIFIYGKSIRESLEQIHTIRFKCLITVITDDLNSVNIKE